MALYVPGSTAATTCKHAERRMHVAGTVNHRNDPATVVDLPHPVFGNGARVVLQLPLAPGPDEAVVLANALNAQEFDWVPPGLALLGAWSPDFLVSDMNGWHSRHLFPTNSPARGCWRICSPMSPGHGSLPTASDLKDRA